MAKDVITRFKLETTQFDSKIKNAAKELSDIAKTAKGAGADFNRFTQQNMAAARALGTIATSSTNAKDRAKELVGAFNDVARSYNQLTKEQQQSDFGKAMSQSLTQLQQRIRETKEEMKGLESAGGGLFGGKLDGMLQVFGGNLMTKGAMAIGSFVSEMGDMVKQGVEMAKAGEGIRIAFERLNRPDLLDKLREATHGTVSDIELMKSAVKFNDFNLSLDELGTMLEFAQQKAKDTGQSVDYMVDSIVTGLGRKSLMILDNLGLSATEVKEKMKQTGDMTSAVGAIIREQMSKAGDYVETAADRAQQANVALQNKLEELGRKFMPLEQASNQFWTSMKIGILDIVGGPLARLLNGLTEAGRLMNQQMDVDAAKGRLGGSGRVDSMVSQLGSGKGSGSYNTYKRQLAEFDKYINGKRFSISAMSGDNSAIGKQNRQRLQNELDAALQMRAEYVKKAQDLHKKSTAKIVDSNNNEINSINELKKQLADLQAQRRKVKAGTDEAKNLDTQIRNIKADIKAQGGSTTTSKTKLPAAQQAEVDITKAQKAYADAINDAKVKVEEGIMTEDDQDKAIYSAKEQLSNAYLKAYNATGDSKYLEAQKEVAESMVFMKGVIEQSAQEQKQLEQQTRELNEQEKKISDATEELYQAMKDGDLKGFYAASKKLKSAGGEDVSYKGTVKATQENMSALTAHLREQMGKAEVGSADFSKLSAKIVDINSLQSIINTQLKNGLSIDPETTKSLMSQIINGDNIDDSVWQGLQDKINEQLKAMGIDPVKIDFKTGNIVETGKQTEKSWKAAAGAMSQVGSALQQIEDPSAKIAGIVGQAIANIALGFAQATTTTGAAAGIFGWIAAIAGGMATMLSTISAIHNATGYQYGGMVKGYAQGGAVGGVVQGTTYSGDQIPIMANAGEVVLTRAMAGNLASQLEGAGAFNNLELTTVIGAEDIKLVLNNRGRRTGKGEYVQSKFRRS